MSTYKVIAPGFYGDKYYHPEGKRKTLTTDKPFTKGKKSKNPIPSWLSEMPKESDALKAKREAYEKAGQELAEKKAEEDKTAIATAASEGDGQDTSFLDKVKNVVTGGKNDNVETL